MGNTLFLYIDILGFSELIKEKPRVENLYRILDKATMHSDSNYRCIVFSDTIVAYNVHTNLSASAKTTELMFLIELTQDIFLRLIGTGIFFRAVITEGEFFHSQLTNLQAYFGQALVDAYRSEKSLLGTGLFLDKRLRKYNQVFRFKQHSEKFDYIFLTHYCTGLTSWLERNVDENSGIKQSEFPLPGELLTSGGIEYFVYPEVVHFHEIYEYMNNHPQPNVRAKFLTTWNMYCHGYPGLMRSLVDHDFMPDGLAKLDWQNAKERYEKENT